MFDVVKGSGCPKSKDVQSNKVGIPTNQRIMSGKNVVNSSIFYLIS
jgi:hypothetical protein